VWSGVGRALLTTAFAALRAHAEARPPDTRCPVVAFCAQHSQCLRPCLIALPTCSSSVLPSSMAPTLRSDRQLESTVTRPASSQVMSPIRAQHSTEEAVIGGSEVASLDQEPDEATQRLAESVQFARSIAETGRSSGQDCSTMSHADAEHLIRSLVEIPGERPLIRVLLEGMERSNTAEAQPVGNPPPPPPPHSEGSDGSRDGEEGPGRPRSSDDALLDNIHSGGRYDDRELADYRRPCATRPASSCPSSTPRRITRRGRARCPCTLTRARLAT
jgi:hypothetical protein